MELLRCFKCRDVGHKRLSCLHGAVQARSSRGDSARQQQQQHRASQQENTEVPESAAGLSAPQTSDPPKSLPIKVSPERTDSMGTHTTLSTNVNATTDVNSASVDHDKSTLTSADSDPAPNVCSAQVQQPQSRTFPLTPQKSTTAKAKRKREDTSATETISKHQILSQSLSAATLETGGAGCIKANTYNHRHSGTSKPHSRTNYRYLT